MIAAAFRRAGFVVPDVRSGPAVSAVLRDLAYAAGFFLCYMVADLSTRGPARLREADGSAPLLVLASLRANWPVVAVVVLMTVGLAVRSPGRFGAGWFAIEHGSKLRFVAAPLLALLVWQGSLYQYNYLLDRGHLIDRFLIVALATAALWRPAFLVPFALQYRIVAAQFGFPFGTTAAQNIDELLVVMLLAVAGAYLMYVVTGRADSSPVFLVMAAALATHFFIPGRGKLLLGWFRHEDLSNLAGNGYVIGWLGQTDGGFSRWLAEVVALFHGPLLVATLLLELGAVLVVAHHRLFRLWLPVVAVFHVINFLLLGFWFLEWIVVEMVLFVLLSRADLRPWLDRNLRTPRVALAVVAVGLVGAVMFHPPGLAWYDTPLVYGYEMEVTGAGGATYNLPVEAIAPFSQELAFSRLQLGPTHPLTGAWGVVATADDLAMVEGLRDLDEVAAAETPVESELDEHHARVEDFLERFVANANRRATGDNRLADILAVVAPLPKYWLGRPEPTYDFQEPIERLEIHRVTDLRVDADHHRRRTLVMTIDAR